VQEALRAHFRPEFLNRIDEVVIFHRLGLREIKQIVDLQMRQLARRLQDRKLGLHLTEGAREFLARQGFDPAYGARPLKRTIQRLVQDPLARRMLEGDFGEGDTVEIGLAGGEIVFRAGRRESEGR
jgi:ATP-dependent Clp protease ATP-binding subunit ClpB